MDSDDSRGTWSDGDTPTLGAGSARRRGAERQRQINGEGGGAEAPAQWPGGPIPGAAAPDQPGEWAHSGATTVGVRRRTETLPIMGQAVLVDDHPQWSGSAAADQRRRRRDSCPQHSGPAGPARGQRLRISPANGQRRQSG
jgi:hypothetical protein